MGDYIESKGERDRKRETERERETEKETERERDETVKTQNCMISVI